MYMQNWTNYVLFLCVISCTEMKELAIMPLKLVRLDIINRWSILHKES